MFLESNAHLAFINNQHLDYELIELLINYILYLADRILCTSIGQTNVGWTINFIEYLLPFILTSQTFTCN